MYLTKILNLLPEKLGAKVFPVRCFIKIVEWQPIRYEQLLRERLETNQIRAIAERASRIPSLTKNSIRIAKHTQRLTLGGKIGPIRFEQLLRASTLRSFWSSLYWKILSGLQNTPRVPETKFSADLGVGRSALLSFKFSWRHQSACGWCRQTRNQNIPSNKSLPLENLWRKIALAWNQSIKFDF